MEKFKVPRNTIHIALSSALDWLNTNNKSITSGPLMDAIFDEFASTVPKAINFANKMTFNGLRLTAEADFMHKMRLMGVRAAKTAVSKQDA